MGRPRNVGRQQPEKTEMLRLMGPRFRKDILLQRSVPPNRSNAEEPLITTTPLRGLPGGLFGGAGTDRRWNGSAYHVKTEPAGCFLFTEIGAREFKKRPPRRPSPGEKEQGKTTKERHKHHTAFFTFVGVKTKFDSVVSRTWTAHCVRRCDRQKKKWRYDARENQ